MITILSIEPSTRKNKRFKAVLSNGSQIDFGLKGGDTYIDHHDANKRLGYHSRHYGNKREKELIDTLTLSPSLLSMYLLWGQYDTIEENLKYLNKLLEWKKK